MTFIVATKVRNFLFIDVSIVIAIFLAYFVTSRLQIPKKMKATLITNLAVLALASVGHAFVVETFPNGNCEGDATEVEVGDDTCAADQTAFRSIRPKSYGAEDQMAVIYESTSCEMDVFAGGTMWADGSDSLFQEGECLDMGFESSAIASEFKEH